MEKDLGKISPFRVRDKRRALSAKLRFLKEAVKQGQIGFALKRLFNLNVMYVICYETAHDANEAWFMHQCCTKNRKLLDRHERIWKTRIYPSILTVVNEL